MYSVYTTSMTIYNALRSVEQQYSVPKHIPASLSCLHVYSVVIIRIILVDRFHSVSAVQYYRTLLYYHRQVDSGVVLRVGGHFCTTHPPSSLRLSYGTVVVIFTNMCTHITLHNLLLSCRNSNSRHGSGGGHTLLAMTFKSHGERFENSLELFVHEFLQAHDDVLAIGIAAQLDDILFDIAQDSGPLALIRHIEHLLHYIVRVRIPHHGF